MRGEIRNYELGIRNSELTPAMERWRERLAQGYTIRARLRMGRRGYVEWGPALFSPEGEFVRNMRRDTLRKLMRLGLLTDGASAAQARDEDNDAGDAAPVDGSGRCVDRDSE